MNTQKQDYINSIKKLEKFNSNKDFNYEELKDYSLQDVYRLFDTLQTISNMNVHLERILKEGFSEEVKNPVKVEAKYLIEEVKKDSSFSYHAIYINKNKSYSKFEFEKLFKDFISGKTINDWFLNSIPLNF